MEVCLEVWRTSMNYKVIRDFRLLYPVKPLPLHSSSTATYTFEYDENSCIKEESKNYDGYIENFYYTYFSE